MKQDTSKHHIFIIGSVWVEPKSSAAGSRMLQFIQLFLEQNWKVTFGTTAQKNPNSIDLTQLGVEEVSLELNDSRFDEFVQKLNPSIVIFDRFMTEEQFGWRIAEQCPNTLRILDTEDLHCLRKTREEAIKKEVEFTNELLRNSEIAKREMASIYRCDLTLIISTFELELLHDVFGIRKELLCYVPFLLNAIETQQQKNWKPYEDRVDFISIGNFLHAPNLDATLQLKKHIWKHIRKEIPTAKLHVYGAYPTQQVQQFHNEKEGFHVHGFVENADEVMEESRVLLAPLRFGAGIKGKLVDAMQNGTPSVTTSIGSEGMCEGMPWNGYVEDDFEDFATKAVALYSDKGVWNQAQRNGVEIINQRYDKEKLIPNFLNTIDAVFENLEQHRNQNFIGTMLHHHLLKSTKYLSKWIEVKNK